MEDDAKPCDVHTVQIKRLERDVCTNKNELKDARKSLAHDMERRDTSFKVSHVTKDEFEPIKKIVYGLIIVILAEVIRRAFF